MRHAKHLIRVQFLHPLLPDLSTRLFAPPSLIQSKYGIHAYSYAPVAGGAEKRGGGRKHPLLSDSLVRRLIQCTCSLTMNDFMENRPKPSESIRENEG